MFHCKSLPHHVPTWLVKHVHARVRTHTRISSEMIFVCSCSGMKSNLLAGEGWTYVLFSTLEEEECVNRSWAKTQCHIGAPVPPHFPFIISDTRTYRRTGIFQVNSRFFTGEFHRVTKHNYFVKMVQNILLVSMSCRWAVPFLMNLHYFSRHLCTNIHTFYFLHWRNVESYFGV